MTAPHTEPRSGASASGNSGGPTRPWWRSRPAVGVAVFAAIVAVGAVIVYGFDETPGMTGDGMAGMDEMAAQAPRVPPVFGYYAGQEVFFIHPEASDPDIADLLDDMMGSPVLTVPSLADVPEHARGLVYVFTNGIVPTDTPTGPLGFQPDVFDSAPGDAAYTPLRQVVLVTWADEADPRVLTDAAQVTDAQAAGQVALEPTEVVVNMPLLTWPGGQR